MSALDDYQRRQLKREIETIVDIVSRRLDGFIQAEWPSMAENERQATVVAVVDSFNANELSDSALFEANADPVALARRIRATTASRKRVSLLRADATELYDRMMDESCLLYTQLVVGLAPFADRALVELLARSSSLSRQVELIIQRLPIGTLDAPDGTAYDADFRSRYLTHISSTLDFVELFGIDVNRYRPVATLTVAYISLSVTSSRAQTESEVENGSEEKLNRSNGEPEAMEDSRDGVKQLSIQVEEALGSANRILLRGEAGSGKTTLLSWLAVMAARASFKGSLATWNNKIPFLIKLRGYVDATLPNPEDFLADTAAIISGIMPRGWVHRKLRDGDALLLIDGVDELPAGQRGAVRTWLSNIVQEYSQCTIVVTSRLAAAGNKWLNKEGFRSITFDRMGQSEISALISHWHSAIRHTGNLPCAESELPVYESDLLAQIDSTSHLRALATNPLLCAMLCALNLDRHRVLPLNKMAIYDAALNMLLERRDSERGLRPNLSTIIDISTKLKVLQILAWKLSLNGRTEVDKSRAVSYFGERLRSIGYSEVAAAEVVDYLTLRSGVIREPIVGRIDFVHRTFQEYLTAREAAEQGDIDFLVERAHLDTWSDTIVMAAGYAHKPTRTELFQGLLARAEVYNRYTRRIKLIIAACLDTSGLLDSDINANVEKCINDLVPPTNRNEARSLALAGRVVLRFIPHDSTSFGESIASSMAWSVGLIGGPGALDLLSKYAKDNRHRVRSQIVELARYFDPKEYAERVLSRIPQGYPFIISSRSELACIRYLENATVRKIRLLETADLAEDLRDLKSISSVEARGEITDISVLERYAESLNEVLLFSGVPALSFASLTKLPKLSRLYIDYPTLPQLSFVADLPKLRRLAVARISDGFNLSPLSAQTKVKSLRLLGAGTCSFDFLRVMPELEMLELFGVGPVGGLGELVRLAPRLKNLQVYSGNWIDDLSSIRNFESLEKLMIDSTSVSDISPLEDATLLKDVHLVCRNVVDFTSILRMPVLQSASLALPLGADSAKAASKIRHDNRVQIRFQNAYFRSTR